MFYLKFIESNTALFIQKENDSQKDDPAYNGIFHSFNSDTSFFVSGEDLYNNFSILGENTRLKITFFRESKVYTFIGIAKKAKLDGANHLTLIEQISVINESSRREYERYETRREVQVYGLATHDMLVPGYSKASDNAEFCGDMFDISAGGLCLVSNKSLTSVYEPYFLLEFSLGLRDNFLLPSKLVRKGDCPQTTLYKYDYGFEFIFAPVPEEKDRLVIAIFNAKFAEFRR